MTDTEIDALEAAAKAVKQPFPCCCYSGTDNATTDYIAAVNPDVVLELIAELRQARKERDWICQEIEETNNRIEISDDLCCPNEKRDCPDNTTCYKCWLEAAKKATHGV